jgi:hypothetical protein
MRLLPDSLAHLVSYDAGRPRSRASLSMGVLSVLDAGYRATYAESAYLMAGRRRLVSQLSWRATRPGTGSTGCSLVAAQLASSASASAAAEAGPAV